MIPIKQSILLGALLLVLAAGSANAAVVKANIPFPFVVHGQTMPAGEYTLQQSADEPSLLLIRERNGDHARALVLTEPAATPDPAGQKSAIRFTRHDGQYWLADVWESPREGSEVAVPVHR